MVNLLNLIYILIKDTSIQENGCSSTILIHETLQIFSLKMVHVSSSVLLNTLILDFAQKIVKIMKHLLKLNKNVLILSSVKE